MKAKKDMHKHHKEMKKFHEKEMAHHEKEMKKHGDVKEDEKLLKKKVKKDCLK